VAVKVSDRKEFQKAAIDFYDAFLPALMSLDERYSLETADEPTVQEVIEKTFPQQISAMLRFRLYLPTRRREFFDHAWCEYCRYDIDEDKHPFLAQYGEKFWDGHPTRQLALDRINKLLSFAEITNGTAHIPG